MHHEGVSVIIPVYNEAAAIRDTIRRAFSVCEKLARPFEIIVVDDGSKDGTGDVARGMGTTILTQPANGGYGLALQRGIRYAQYTHIVITDADGTYHIEELPGLMEEMEKGFAMVVGARQGKFFEGSFVKSVSRKIFIWLAEYVAGRSIPDINSGFRVFRRDIALPHLPRTCFGFSFTTSLTLIFMLQGYFIHYLPIAYHTRVGKTKVRHFRDALRTLQIMTEVILRYNPIKLFLLVALLVGSLALVVGGLGWWLADGILFLAGWIMLASSVLVVSLGFMAESFRTHGN